MHFAPEIEQRLKRSDGHSCFCSRKKKTEKSDYWVSSFSLKLSDPEMNKEYTNYLLMEAKTRGIVVLSVLGVILLVLLAV